jgi:dTDP-4-amino-4,6-dideoxygalactose transaminase
MDPTLPALLGGAPIRPQGPPDWPLRDEAVRAALESAWRDGSWGRYDGGHVRQLQERLALAYDVPHVLACGSGTWAVELALRALPVRAGEEVVLAAYDYPGNFLSVHAIGACPLLVDVDPANMNLSVKSLADTLARSSPRAVLVSHLHGGLVPMREVMDLCSSRGIPVIEDAAQCPGATVQGRPAGAWGDVGILSFGGSKLLSAGRGGALLTRRPDVHQRARLIQGRSNNLVCPLSELQAAVLLPQLDQLPARHSLRGRAVQLLAGLLADVPGLRLFQNTCDGSPGYYKVGFLWDEAPLGLSRGCLLAAVRAEGFALDEGFRALHAGRSAQRWRAVAPLPGADRAHREILILHHPLLQESDPDLGQLAEAFARIRAFAEQLRGCAGR